MRDLRAIGFKLKQVFLPKGNAQHLLKDWDLCNSRPLNDRGSFVVVFSLVHVILKKIIFSRLSLAAASNQVEMVFTYSFGVVWAGAAIVTLNSKLLGGRLSFFQSVCVLGYCMCPLVLAAFLTMVTRILPFGNILKFFLLILSCAWSVYASLGFLSDLNLEKRKGLALYPIFFFYFVLAWLVCFF